jgi:hypothetical protein
MYGSRRPGHESSRRSVLPPWRRAGAGAALLALVVAAPASAGGGWVDRVTGFESAVAVAMPPDFPIGSISRASCAFTELVTHPDGTARETMHCQLNDNPTLVPEFQGHAPDTAFLLSGGVCAWISDYWFAKTGAIVYAVSFSYEVTPSGRVNARAEYPAQPLVCE